LGETLAFAKSLNKARGIISEMKSRMYQDIVQVLDTKDGPFIESGRFLF